MMSSSRNQPRPTGPARICRVANIGLGFSIPGEPPGGDQIRRVVAVFDELRDGVTEDGKAKVRQSSGSMSTAVAIAVVIQVLALAAYFGDGGMQMRDLAAGLQGAVVKDPVHDIIVWREYLETVIKERPDWQDLYRAARKTA